MTIIQINRKLLLMKLHYFIGIGGYAPFSPFMATIAKQRGYSAVIVGFIFMVQPIPGLFIRPVIGVITDKYKCRRVAFILSSLIIFTLVWLFSIIPGTTSKGEMDDYDVIRSPLFWLFFGAILTMSIFDTIKNVMEETICTTLLGVNKYLYGKQRLWGSLGFGIFAIVSGACVDWFSKGQEYKNYTPAFAISLVCFFCDIIIVSNIEVVQDSNIKIVISDLRKIFTKTTVKAFLLWAVMFGFFMSFIWNFVFWYLEDLSSLYHPETNSWMKTLQGLSVIMRCVSGEVLSLFLSSVILRHLDHTNVFSLTFFLFFVDFFLYSVIRNPVWALPIEVINGFTWGLSYSTAISYAAMLSPVGAEGSLQGIAGMAIDGIGSPIGSIFHGYLFKNMGSIASVKLLPAIPLIACILQTIINRQLLRGTTNNTVETKNRIEVDNIIRKF
ncbi:Major facilitator superfamily domain,Major facilitator superfamily associated domain [Cinara cedri]|uniref:Major facilitator superfamily domain,Major facilitator superfamily associated domain n=1 Tax=Cinara cedri TaxID=506608 RepID=A0A5E4NML2_9HEMI|nr:Major facilitator superfamily domain,Major facilitator superfamily associated domain [Cinara cedri]